MSSVVPRSAIFGNLLGSVTRLKDESTYLDWAYGVSTVLRHVGAHDAVTGKVSPPSDKDEKAVYDQHLANGLTAISLTVDASQYVHIRDSIDGAAAWAALQGVYAKNSRANRVALKKLLYSYHHDTSLSILDFVSGIVGIASRLRSIAVTISDEDIVDVLIFQLDSTWGSVADSLLAQDSLTLEAAKGVLASAEARRGGAPAPSDDNVALALYDAKRHQRAGRGSGGNDSKVVCWRCDQVGHKVADCPDRPNTKTGRAGAAVAGNGYAFAF